MVPLTAREFALLHYLMDRQGEVITRTDLLEAVWDANYDGLSNVVDVHVANLRRKLELPGRAGADRDRPRRRVPHGRTEMNIRRTRRGDRDPVRHDRGGDLDHAGAAVARRTGRRDPSRRAGRADRPDGQVFFDELVSGQRPEDFPTWYVDVNDGYVEPYVDTELEPPLYGWIRDAGESPSFRSYSLDGAESYLAYIRPDERGPGLRHPDRDRRPRSPPGFAQPPRARDGRCCFVGGLCRARLLPHRALPSARCGGCWPTSSGFLADAAHEMRTPLAVILASSSQALSRARSSEEYVRSLSEIRVRGRAGVDRRQRDARPGSPRERAGHAAHCAAAARPAGRGGRRRDPPRGLPRSSPSRADPVVVDADMALLRQAIENIVRNAARRATQVELVTRTEGRDGIIEVIDNGTGFDPATVDRVFERFQRGDRQGEAGIGLAIVKAIAAAHGGTASAVNRDGGGAVVALRIPLNRAAHQ